VPHTKPIQDSHSRAAVVAAEEAAPEVLRLQVLAIADQPVELIVAVHPRGLPRARDVEHNLRAMGRAGTRSLRVSVNVVIIIIVVIIILIIIITLSMAASWVAVASGARPSCIDAQCPPGPTRVDSCFLSEPERLGWYSRMQQGPANFFIDSTRPRSKRVLSRVRDESPAEVALIMMHEA
jgi:hypothetical protein